jgi:hypothetical protein
MEKGIMLGKINFSVREIITAAKAGDNEGSELEVLAEHIVGEDDGLLRVLLALVTVTDVRSVTIRET